jgi:alkanesulfonate monooxygenase SsuD/methylene tetrahydromethanopterin reductase-like flavin-dependent oxidoreductase (luciferase family)
MRPEVYADSLAGRKPDFEIVQNISIVVTADVQEGLERMKPMLGFYIGGMGSKKRNFHKELMGRMGFEAEAQKIQDLFFENKREEAIAAVPTEFIDEISLVGPKERIRDRLEAWRESPVTTLVIGGGGVEALRTAAELVL